MGFLVSFYTLDWASFHKAFVFSANFDVRPTKPILTTIFFELRSPYYGKTRDVFLLCTVKIRLSEPAAPVSIQRSSGSGRRHPFRVQCPHNYNVLAFEKGGKMANYGRLPAERSPTRTALIPPFWSSTPATVVRPDSFLTHFSLVSIAAVIVCG